VISIFDKYVLKIFAGSTFITALSLTLVILLTQSIRYLELVIGSDASAFYFLMMIGFAIPKFLDAILPLAFAIGAIYTIYRMMSDREMIIMIASGAAMTTIARGFLIFTFIMMGIQFLISGWFAPMAVNQLQQTQGDLKSHYATLLFREGVFNTLKNGLTVFVEERQSANELKNLMIHDDKGDLNAGQETTIIAKRGLVNITDETQQLLIYNGTQYQRDIKTGQISRLDFDQYSLDVPSQDTIISQRWQKPDERLFQDLFIDNDNATQRDLKKQGEFIAEIHKRISTPLLYMAFLGMILVYSMTGTWNRREQIRPVIKSGIFIVVMQAGYLVIYNKAQDIAMMNVAMYGVASLPIFYSVWAIYRHQHKG